MFENVTCRRCGTELKGALETTMVTSGKYVFVTARETCECNWTRCPGCRTVLCKKCYEDLPEYCCNEGRIIRTERARATAALGRSKPKVSPTGRQ